MATVKLIEPEDAEGKVKEIYDDISKTRGGDKVNNIWKALANDPDLLEATWTRIKQVMAPGALDSVTKELIYIANCLEEVPLSQDTMIFKDGDVGDSMYFIVKGDVKILKGDVELVTLKKGDYFGEMALLDGEARSADAKTASDSILLKLNSDDFEKIMYSNDKIVKGILGMLSQRLRNANELLNQKK